VKSGEIDNLILEKIEDDYESLPEGSGDEVNIDSKSNDYMIIDD